MSVPRSNGACHAFLIAWPLKAVGGVSEVVKNLIREMAASGGGRPLIIESCAASEESEAMAPTFQMKAISPCDARHPMRAFVSFWLKLPGQLRRWGKLCGEQGVDVLNPHFIGPQHLVLAIARRLGFFRGTLVLSFHGSDVHTMVRSRGAERMAYRMLLRGADWLVPCSDGLGSLIREFDPGCANRIRPVRNGINAAHFLAGADEDACLPAEFERGRFVVSIGAFQEQKGHDILLRAFAEVRRNHSDVRLLIAGGQGAEFERTEALAGELGVAEAVLFLKSIPISRVAAVLKAAELFVLPSRREAFGLVLLEAAAAGKPVITTETHGGREIVAHGETGWTVPIERPDLLAEAMEEALKNPEEMARRGGQLQKQVLERFTWTRACEEYTALNRRTGRESRRREGVPGAVR